MISFGNMHQMVKCHLADNLLTLSNFKPLLDKITFIKKEGLKLAKTNTEDKRF